MKAKKTSLDSIQNHIEDIKTAISINQRLFEELLRAKYKGNENTMTQRLEEIKELEERLNEVCLLENEAQVQALVSKQVVQEQKLKLKQKFQDLKEEVWIKENTIQSRVNDIAFVSTMTQELKNKVKQRRYDFLSVISTPKETLIDDFIENQRVRVLMVNEAREMHNNIRYRLQLKKMCRTLLEDCESLKTVLRNPVNRNEKHANLVGLSVNDSQLESNSDSDSEEFQVEDEILNKKYDVAYYMRENKKEFKATYTQLMKILAENEVIRKECESYAEKYRNVADEIDRLSLNP